MMSATHPVLRTQVVDDSVDERPLDIAECPHYCTNRTAELLESSPSAVPVRGVRVSAPYENGTQESGPELAALWARTLERLAGQSEVTPQFQAWLSLTRPIALVEDTAVLAAPHEFAKDVLESRLRPALTAALAAEIGRDVRVAVTVEAAPTERSNRSRRPPSGAPRMRRQRRASRSEPDG